MRIFTVIRHSLNPQYFYSDLWSRNFYPALQKLGHEIIESQVDLLPSSRFMQVPFHFTQQEQEVRDQISQRIVDEIYRLHEQQPIDLFLSYFYNAHFNPEYFKEIHRLGIPTVNFYCNSIYQFELVSAVAAKVNFSWHAERDARPLYLEVGANPIWVQMGADPNIYHPIKGGHRKPSTCFVGQRYADRDRWLAPLLAHNLPIDIYGSGWPRTVSLNSSPEATSPTESSASYSEYLGRKIYPPGSKASYLNLVQEQIQQQGLLKGIARIYRQAQYRRGSRKLDSILAQAYQGFASSLSETFAQYEVVLNFSNVWADGRPGSALIPHVRLRDFEAPMSRTCYLTGYTHEIAEFYDIGTEIDTYQTVDELLDKAQFYLRHPAEAEKMREAGYQRALRDHTWTNRFQQLFEKIGLTSKPLVQ